MLVLYEKKLGKGTYRLGRILDVHPDSHGVVRTVTVGMRRQDKREPVLPYVPKKLDEVTLGIQRLVVISPVEEQEMLEDNGGQDVTVGHVGLDVSVADVNGQDVTVSVKGQDVTVNSGQDVSVSHIGQDVTVFGCGQDVAVVGSEDIG